MKNSSRYFRMKGAMLEGQMTPIFESDNVSAENYDTVVFNPDISGEEYSSLVDESKMDLTW